MLHPLDLGAASSAPAAVPSSCWLTGEAAGVGPSRTRYTRTGLAMFLTACSPRSSYLGASLVLTCSYTVPEMQMPPASARPSRRAAILTPSPRAMLMHSHAYSAGVGL